MLRKGKREEKTKAKGLLTNTQNVIYRRKQYIIQSHTVIYETVSVSRCFHRKKLSTLLSHGDVRTLIGKKVCIKTCISEHLHKATFTQEVAQEASRVLKDESEYRGCPEVMRSAFLTRRLCVLGVPSSWLVSLWALFKTLSCTNYAPLLV